MNSIEFDAWGSVQARIRSATRALEQLMFLPWVPPEPDETGWAMTWELEWFRLTQWLRHLREEEQSLLN